MTQAFTDTAHTAMTVAKEEAKRLGHPFIGTEHYLIGLIESGGLAATLLTSLGVDTDELRDATERLLNSQAKKKSKEGLLPSPLAKRIIDHARREASNRDHLKMGTEHLLLSLLNEPEGGALKVLESLQVDIENLKVALVQRLDSKSTS